MSDQTSPPQAAPPWATGTGAREAQMFPELADSQLKEVCRFGTKETYKTGDYLFRVGDRQTQFHVILSGHIEIVRRGSGGDEEVIAAHGRGRFSGEVSTLTGRAVLVDGRATEDTEVIAVDHEGLKELVATQSQLSDIIMRSFILRRMRMIENNFSGITLVGSRLSRDTLRLREFLTRNGQPHTFLDVETNGDVAELLDRMDIPVEETPIVITLDGQPLRNPSVQDVAQTIGLDPNLDTDGVYDVAVVGAGPAGLAAAVYAASEGLKVIVTEPLAPGGQAGTSSKIENYLGFPTGISGQALAGRAFSQAQKFGAEIAIPRTVTEICCGNPLHQVNLDSGETVSAKSVVVASGARYRKLPLDNLEQFEGTGVYYGATYVESQLCRNEKVVIVGGGNSAGQAAVFLSSHAKHVYIMVRSESLASSMSRYLIRRIEDSDKITLLTKTQITELGGDEHLEQVIWENSETGDREIRDIRHVFVFIGASPNTCWSDERIVRDEIGFIRTGPDIQPEDLSTAGWKLQRQPFLLETSCPGIFAVGDVRSGSVKRVASAVGEGSVVVQFIHRHLSQ